MQSNNMLSAKKIKVHGMNSRRWVIKDKITQYRGIVNLNARDKKIADADVIVTKRKLRKDLYNLQKEIHSQRNILENAIKGDRQQLRNTLADSRSLQLAYQNLPPTRVIDALNQENFNKKKNLDKVNYKLKQKTQKLIDLKLNLADLEDRIKFESSQKIPVEIQAQVVTGKTQDAILKKEAAMAVRDTYKSILDILRRDAIFFDAVLAALQVDGYNQGKCIYRVTEMGQLATEYLDDRKLEYRVVENEIKISMREREKTLQDVQKKLSSISNNVKYLVRRDDSFLDISASARKNADYKMLQHDIEVIQETLNGLKITTLVSKIEDIFPRMLDQQLQKERLEELVRKNTADRDTLLRKSKHAEEMYNTFYHAMVETTFWYKKEKIRISQEMKEINDRIEISKALIEHRGNNFMIIRTALQQVYDVLRNVADPTSAQTASGRGGRKGKNIVQKDVEDLDAIVKPEYVEEDAMKLITSITQKLTNLVAQTIPVTDDASKARAAELFQKFVTDMTGKSQITDSHKKEESLIDDVKLDDPQVPSRTEIKLRSARIVQKYAKTEEEL